MTTEALRIETQCGDSNVIYTINRVCRKHKFVHNNDNT
jgi:hypothetical protein